MDAAAWCRTVDDYLERCFALETPPRGGELAMLLGIAQSVLSKHFSYATDSKLIDYMRHKKLAYAASLLAGTDEPLPRIRRRAGFGSRSSFFREFREAYGVSPERYRGWSRHPAPAHRRRAISDLKTPSRWPRGRFP